eukprot:1142477-Pelagomonas_calceolata.AAC.6
MCVCVCAAPAPAAAAAAAASELECAVRSCVLVGHTPCHSQVHQHRTRCSCVQSVQGPMVDPGEEGRDGLNAGLKSTFLCSLIMGSMANGLFHLQRITYMDNVLNSGNIIKRTLHMVLCSTLKQEQTASRLCFLPLKSPCQEVQASLKRVKWVKALWTNLLKAKSHQALTSRHMKYVSKAQHQAEQPMFLPHNLWGRCLPRPCLPS